MTNPTELLVAGDIHGDPQHLAYIYQTAVNENVGAIVQVGDFGFWEHHPDGGAFLDLCAEGYQLTVKMGTPIPLFWLDGNHENHELLRELYGPGGVRHKLTPEGFWVIRPGMYYLPRGVRWAWAGVRFMALGGAYSIDKKHRLSEQAKDGHPRWWPQEELTEAEVQAAIADPSEIDVLFTHDKPFKARVPWNRRDIIRTWPNQERIQTVVDTLHPKMVIHGHLHIRYQHRFDSTIVEGLGCNPQSPNDNPLDSWLKLRLQ